MAEETVSVTRSVELPATPRDVWAVIGDFHAIDDWHPAIVSSRREQAGEFEYRHLTVSDGGEITEQLLGESGHSYHYRISHGPLPVEHYEATLTLTDTGSGSRVTWSASFTPTAPDAEGVIASIFEAGLGALESRFA
mgnify:CR=1 FL=1|jgi:carbon monoxide dehydrogenase subunit G